MNLERLMLQHKTVPGSSEISNKYHCYTEEIHQDRVLFSYQIQMDVQGSEDLHFL